MGSQRRHSKACAPWELLCCYSGPERLLISIASGASAQGHPLGLFVFSVNGRVYVAQSPSSSNVLREAPRTSHAYPRHSTRAHFWNTTQRSIQRAAGNLCAFTGDKVCERAGRARHPSGAPMHPHGRVSTPRATPLQPCPFWKMESRSYHHPRFPTRVVRKVGVEVVSS